MRKTIPGLVEVRFWTGYIFSSNNFRPGSFLEHVGEPKVNQFLSHNEPLNLLSFKAFCSYLMFLLARLLGDKS